MKPRNGTAPDLIAVETSKRRIGFGIFALAFAVLSSAPAVAAERYISAIIASWHIGNDSLNNITPGVTIGGRWDSDYWPLEYHVEGGIFYNSYEEVSPLVVTGVTASVLSSGEEDLRIGASVGVARYDDLSEDLKSQFGIPNVKGFIPVVFATTEYRRGATSYRITAAPPGEGVAAILNLSIARLF